MTASHIPFEPGSFTAPVVDYEPPPLGLAPAAPAACRPPSPAALHRSPRRPLRSVEHRRAVREASPPRAAAVFADSALRRVLEVIDRRRPIAQLRPLLSPALMDAVLALTRAANHDGAAVLRRVRLRTAACDGHEPHEPIAAEVFATYTRGRRVRAIAARVEFDPGDQRGGHWRLVALHIG